MLNINKQSFYNLELGIKYVTIFSRILYPSSRPGQMEFYNGSCRYVVYVKINPEKKRNLVPEDVEILYGDHNADDIVEVIKEKQQAIMGLCKIFYKSWFALDLEKMRVLERENFNCKLPSFKLDTPFILSGINSEKVFILRNTAINFSDADIFVWLLSYIYSTLVCVIPISDQTKEGKQFMQVMAQLETLNDPTRVNIVENVSVLSPDLGNNGEISIEPPGDTERFAQLVERSKKEFDNKKGKKYESKNE